MGANCLSVMLHSHEEETGRARLSVCSGGDDQSIGISTFSVEITGHVALPEVRVQACVESLYTTTNINTSAPLCIFVLA